MARDLSKDAVPRKWIEPLVPEELPKLTHPEYFEDLDKAKAQLATGRYKLALATLYSAKGIDPVEAALVRGAALNALGRTDEAMSALSAEGVADTPRSQVLRAVVLSGMGKDVEAAELLQAHVKAHPNSLPGHYQLGVVSERLGDVATATAAYGWFFDEPQRYLDKWQGQGPEAFESAEDVTLIGRALDRHATLTGAYRGNAELNNIILNMFVRAYDIIDRGYTPAHVAAAAYFVAHDDKPQAKKELAAALAGNPNDAEAIELAAHVAIDEHNLPGALDAADQLRATNPNSLSADLIELHAVVRGDRSRRAAMLSEKLLAKHPTHLEALGLAAAAASTRSDQAACDALLARADAAAPGTAVALFTLAEVLPDVHQYDAAEKYCKVAVERAPLWAAPRHRLGRLHMQLAEEEAARAEFEAAYELDPFNVSTVNYLRLLDDMQNFETAKTEHFVVKFDPKFDPILGEYLGPLMEKVHAEVCRDFKHEPARTTVLEVFPTTDSFSVRTAGVPGAETYGASFGPVITAVAPRAGATLGPFNFARVLRHEFTHVINMAATDQRCPRWLTEGLATWQEGVPFRFAWVPKSFYERVTKDKLFPISEMSQTLLRPKEGTDGEIVYMEAFWIARYMDERYGRDSIIKLLDAFKQGKTEDEAFRMAVGKPMPEFQAEFFAWAKQQVKDWGYDAETMKKFEALAKDGEEKIKAGQHKEALEVWQQATKLQPHNPLPHRRLAGLYLRLSSPKDALPHLQAFLPLELQENRYAKGISKIHRDLGDVKEATRFAMEAIYINPYDADAHELLVELYEKSNDAEGVAREKRVLAKLEELKKQPNP